MPVTVRPGLPVWRDYTSNSLQSSSSSSRCGPGVWSIVLDWFYQKGIFMGEPEWILYQQIAIGRVRWEQREKELEKGKDREKGRKHLWCTLNCLPNFCLQLSIWGSSCSNDVLQTTYCCNASWSSIALMTCCHNTSSERCPAGTGVLETKQLHKLLYGRPLPLPLPPHNCCEFLFCSIKDLSFENCGPEQALVKQALIVS